MSNPRTGRHCHTYHRGRFGQFPSIHNGARCDEPWSVDLDGYCDSGWLPFESYQCRWACMDWRFSPPEYCWLPFAMWSASWHSCQKRRGVDGGWR